MIGRFVTTTLGSLIFLVEKLWLLAPRGFSWRHVAASTWISTALIALAFGVLIALVELAYNLTRPRSGRFGRRRPISILDFWPPGL